ncbi:MAG TPA: MarR family winged helix-turn-helix transcriptional regulator [Aggregatilineales bacterium]|nr:MarR family winged helix-turn-helix transcriptional regulator [Aggregatilineales bacterium]
MLEKNAHPDLGSYQHVVTACACGNLRKTSRAITQLYDGFLEPSGLLSTQMMLLGAIGTNPTITLKPLAERLGMDPTTLARNLKPLERDGLIAISKGTDCRTREVSLTQQGQKALVNAYPLWEQAQAYVSSQFGADRLQAMLDDLSELTSKLR